MFSRVGSTVNRPSSFTPSVGVGCEQVDAQPGPIRDQPAGPGPDCPARDRTAVPPPSELPTSAARSMPRWSNNRAKQRGGAVPVVLLVFGDCLSRKCPYGLIGTASTWKCPGQHGDVLGSSTSWTRRDRHRAAAPRSAPTDRRPRGSAAACSACRHRPSAYREGTRTSRGRLATDQTIACAGNRTPRYRRSGGALGIVGRAHPPGVCVPPQNRCTGYHWPTRWRSGRPGTAPVDRRDRPPVCPDLVAAGPGLARTGSLAGRPGKAYSSAETADRLPPRGVDGDRKCLGGPDLGERVVLAFSGEHPPHHLPWELLICGGVAEHRRP